MKNIKNNIYILVAFVSIFTSCKKSFLDEQPSTSVSVSKAINTESDMMDATSGMYTALKSSSFLGRDAAVLGDLLADNTYLSTSNSGRFITQNNYTFTATTTEPANIWGQGYYTILQANRIIGTTLSLTDNVKQMKGEAYAIRALSYLTLVNWFATPYTVNSSAAGVPIVTVSTDIVGGFNKPARNTVAEVYSKIISDLDSAYLLMPTTTATIHTASSNFIAKYAVKALQARAYLYKGDYANARDAALLVVQSGGYSLASTSAIFANYWASPAARTDKLETIFELNMSSTSNNGTNSLDYIYSQSGGYGDLLVTDNTYALYTSTDARRALITSGTRASYQAYIVNKYQNVLNTDRDDVKVIRYAEVLLTLAEAYARLGDEPNALIYLNRVAQNRDASQVAYVYTGTTLIDAIINERRKELAFEGLRFFDLARTNSVITRQNMGVKAYSFYTSVSTSDVRRIQPIPSGEVAANPNITQNPGY